ncbi:MAG: hypothetical protein Q8P50_13110 [Bacillota bacterium]|nr:hypothetical protein [Bacillota bacterium]
MPTVKPASQWRQTAGWAALAEFIKQAAVLALCLLTLASGCTQGPAALTALPSGKPSAPPAERPPSPVEPPPSQVELVARLDMPSSRVLVVLTVPRPQAGLLRLSFRDLDAILDRLRSMSVKADGRPLATQKTSGNWDFQFEVPQKTQVLSVSYTVDPRWSAPGSSHTDTKSQRSYIRDYGAILRGCVVFPRVDPQIGPLRVRFLLPQGWTAVVPWEKSDAGYLVEPSALLDDYVALGRFDLEELQVAGSQVTLAVWAGLGQKNQSKFGSNELRKLVTWLAKTLGPLPSGGRSIAAFPSEYLGGGAASAGTVVTELSARTMAHEIVHWWNGWTFKTARDATWLGEGVTDYLAPKALWKAGVWSKKQFESEIRAYATGLKTLELRENKCFSLGEASENYWKENSPWHAVVYQKGALLGLVIDAAIHEASRGKHSIESVIAALCAGRSQTVTTPNIEDAVLRATGVDIRPLVDRYVRKAAAIPDVEALLKSIR